MDALSTSEVDIFLFAKSHDLECSILSRIIMRYQAHDVDVMLLEPFQ